MGKTLPKILSSHYFYVALAILSSAFFLRVIFLPNRGFEADVSFWKSWGLATFDYGVVEGIKRTNNNYPTPFAYVLGVMTWVYSLFADPHNFYEYWSNTNMLFLTISKMPSVIADYCIAGILYFVGKHAKAFSFPELPKEYWLVLIGLYLLNPLSILDGAWWGQVDSLGVLVFLLAVLALIRNKPLLAGVIYMAAMMTKLQNMIYGPIFFLLVWQLTGLRGLLKAGFGSLAAFMIFNIEFFKAHEMSRVIGSLTDNFDYFPLMSLNAYNPWWIFAGGNGMKMSDKYIAWGITNAKSLGLMLFSSGYLMAALHQATPTFTRMFSKDGVITTPTDRQDTIGRFFGALIIANSAFFLFQTQSHDRYVFPVCVFLLFWGTFRIAGTMKKTEREEILSSKRMYNFLLWYGIFSLVYFYNLHTALVSNYPDNGLPILNQITSPFFTITTAYVLTSLFVLFLAVIKRETRLTTYVIPVVFFLFLFAKANSPLFFKTPVLVSHLTPVASHQDYGDRMTDMPTDASNGFTHWQPLSIQYYFFKYGIGTHAKSYHIYDINRAYKTLTTNYGIDTTAGAKGTGVFSVWGDDKLLWRSDKIGRYDNPRFVEVNVTGVKKLALTTDDADDGINDDHTIWVNAKLWPK